MAKRIIWSLNAQLDRKLIFSYWNKRNKSKAYSITLNHLFIEAIELIAIHPLIGRATNFENIRAKIVRDYLIVYRITDLEIQILSIFDSRQDPEILEEIMTSLD